MARRDDPREATSSPPAVLFLRLAPDGAVSPEPPGHDWPAEAVKRLGEAALRLRKGEARSTSLDLPDERRVGLHLPAQQHGEVLAVAVDETCFADLSERLSRLRRFNTALSELSRSRIGEEQGLRAALRELTALSAATLEVERVSVWLLDDESRRINCEDLFEWSASRHGTARALTEDDCPAYFRALDEHRAIAADDARADPRLADLADCYLETLGIGALLDAPIRAFGSFVGVVCHEHVGPPRHWTEEEQAFAASIADCASVAIEAEHRREAERRLRAAASCASDLIYEIDLETRRERWFGDVERWLGYKEGEYPSSLDGRLRLIHPDDRARVRDAARRAIESGDRFVQQYRIRHQDGSWRYWLDRVQGFPGPDGRMEQAVGTVSDITEAIRVEQEREQLTAQLHRVQRLDALGVLASGIAHDFNNALTSIIGFGELLKADLPAGSRPRARAESILVASMRAAQVVRQILTFGRRGTPERKPLDMAGLVRESLQLMRASMPATIIMRQEIDTDVGRVLADAGQIQQAVVNLCTNAFQAMAESGGTLTVGLSRVTGGPPRAAAAAGPGPWLQFLVRDTGPGINPAIAERIYEPFFTTKPVGKGTGLGLSVVHGIVTAHGGAIDFQSVPGRGTSFVVYLPAYEGDAEPEAEPDKDPTVPHGTERILVVDDEPEIVQALQQWLERLGYRVTARNSSTESLAAFQADPRAFDLVLTDMTMPHLTGVDLAWRLLQARPELPILLMTGFSDLTSPEGARRLGIREFLVKPLNFPELARVVRRVLDEAAQAERMESQPGEL